MTVILATALAIPWCQRLCTVYFADGFLVRPSQGPWTVQLILLNILSLGGNFVAHAVVLATLAILAMRLREPRPPLPRLARQPGFIACCTVVLTVIVSDLDYLGRVSYLGVDNPYRKGFSNELFRVLADGVAYSFTRNGYTVSAAWLTLALGRRWRAEPCWIDRAGRLIGLFWIAMIAVYWWISLYRGGV